MGSIENKLAALAVTGHEAVNSRPYDVTLAEAIYNVVKESHQFLGDPSLERFANGLIAFTNIPEDTKPLALSDDEKRNLRSVCGGMNEETEAWLRDWLQEESSSST